MTNDDSNDRKGRGEMGRKEIRQNTITQARWMSVKQAGFAHDPLKAPIVTGRPEQPTFSLVVMSTTWGMSSSDMLLLGW